MPIANYTSGVAADRSRGEVERMLVAVGARGISTEYDNRGRAVGLHFAMPGRRGGLDHYRLPVRIAGTLAALERDGVERRYRTIEHAEKVAWRCLRDWVRAQLALIAAGLSTVDEVMFPHSITRTGATAYETYRKRIESADTQQAVTP